MRRGHVLYEHWVYLAVTLVLLAIAVPYFERGRWIVGGLWLTPVLVLTGGMVRAWWERRG